MARPQSIIVANSDGPEYAETLTLSADTVFLNDKGVAVPCRAVFVGTTGNVAVRMMDGSTHTYRNLPSGSRLVGRFAAVLSTGNGTSAANLIAEW